MIVHQVWAIFYCATIQGAAYVQITNTAAKYRHKAPTSQTSLTKKTTTCE